jgi:transcription-repair coupling factor (superfamily II helicase)
MSLRIQLYRRFASIESETELDAMQAELLDRFGPPPRAVQGLLLQIRVKLLAQQAGATAVGCESGRPHIKLPYLGSIDRSALQTYLGDDVRVSRTAVWLPQGLPDAQWQSLLLDVLHRLKRERLSAAVGDFIGKAP